MGAFTGPRSADAAAALRGYALTPGLVAFLSSARLRDSPHRLFAALRRVDPIHRSPFGFWVLTRHADIEAMLRDPHMSVEEADVDTSLLRIGALSGLGTAATRDGAFTEASRDFMLFRNPPDHTRLRSLVSRAFTPRRVADLEDRIVAIAEQSIDELRDRPRFDLMSELAYPFPAKVICELLGLPRSDHHLIAQHGAALAVGLDPFPSAAELQRADGSFLALRAHLTPILADRRRNPRDDLLTALVDAADGEDRLSDDELIATVVLLLVAGHETTANLIGNAMVLLDGAPLERERLRSGDADPHTAVDEFLRVDPPVQMTQRIAVDTVEIGPHRVPAGTIVALLLAAANRDPQVFEDPHRLDLDRSPNRHLTFGGGVHYCLGAALARSEATILLPRLLRAMPHLSIIGPAPRHRPSITIRGYAHLPVQQRPDAAGIG